MRCVGSSPVEESGTAQHNANEETHEKRCVEIQHRNTTWRHPAGLLCRPLESFVYAPKMSTKGRCVGSHTPWKGMSKRSKVRTKVYEMEDMAKAKRRLSYAQHKNHEQATGQNFFSTSPPPRTDPPWRRACKHNMIRAKAPRQDMEHHLGGVLWRCPYGLLHSWATEVRKVIEHHIGMFCHGWEHKQKRHWASGQRSTM